MDPSASNGPRTLEQIGDAGGNPVPVPGPEQPPLLIRILFGAQGLRAAWGVLCFQMVRALLIVGCTLPLLKRIFPGFTPAEFFRHPGGVMAFEAGTLSSAIAATWLMAKLEHRRIADYGFASQRGLRNFGMGLGWGAALLSLLVALLHAAGLLIFDARLLSGSAAVRQGLFWLIAFLMVGLSEEISSRGYMQFTLTRGFGELFRWLFGPRHSNALGFWTAAVVLSYFFGAGHSTNPGESPLGLLDAGLFGLLFCLSLWRTGSLWWAIGFHASWDWAQSFLYGVPDSGLLSDSRLLATHAVGSPRLSGGLTGPEGSLLFFPVALLMACVVLLTLPRTHCGYVAAGAQESSSEARSQDQPQVLP